MTAQTTYTSGTSRRGHSPSAASSRTRSCSPVFVSQHSSPRWPRSPSVASSHGRGVGEGSRGRPSTRWDDPNCLLVHLPGVVLLLVVERNYLPALLHNLGGQMRTVRRCSARWTLSTVANLRSMNGLLEALSESRKICGFHMACLVRFLEVTSSFLLLSSPAHLWQQ